MALKIEGANVTQLFQKRFNELAAQIGEVEATQKSSYSSFTGRSTESLDDSKLLNWCVKVRSLLASVCGKESEHFLSFTQSESPKSFSSNIRTLEQLKAVFFAAKEDFEGGYLNSYRNLVQAEIFDSELEQAKELLASGFYVAAAVISGVVLETTLRDLCTEEGIAHGKLDKMNADLAKAGKYNLLVQKRITALAGIRNSAAHGKPEEFTKDDVAAMIFDVERFVSDMLSSRAP